MSKQQARTWTRGAAVSFAFGLVAGFTVWSASSRLTGHQEPWDGDTGFYYWYLLGVGVVAGLVIPRSFWACPSGIYVGQAVAMLALLKVGSLAPLGLLLALPFMSIVCLVGWCIGAALHRLTAMALSRVSQPTK